MTQINGIAGRPSAQRTNNDHSGSKNVKAKPAPQTLTKSDEHKAVAGSTSYSEIMKEATDGDTSEAFSLGVLGGAGGRPGRQRDDRKRDDKTIGGSGGQEYHGTPDEENSESFDPLERLRARVDSKSAPSGETTKAGAIGTKQIGAVTTRHENLMVVSSMMQPRQIATHIGQQNFHSVAAVFGKPMWIREPNGREQFMATQMTATKQRLG